jgi:hypothetical protein
MLLSAIGFFCEDIREETKGTFSLVGVVPDTMELPAIPATLPKLALFVRLRFSLDHKPESLRLVLRWPGGSDQELSRTPPQLIEDAITKTKQGPFPYAGVNLNVIFSPLKVPVRGLAKATVYYSGGETDVAGINFATP